MYKQSLKLQSLSCFRMSIIGCNKGVKIHPWLAQDVIKHVKRFSSYDSLRNGWRFVRLLAGKSKPSSTLARKDWELAAILSKGEVYPGCFPAILPGMGGEEEKKRKSYTSVFVIVLQRNPLVILPKERTRVTFIWPYQKGTPLSLAR